MLLCNKLFQEFMGRDSPPSVLYNPDTSNTKRADPLFSIGKSPRFHIPFNESSLKS